MSLAVGRMLIPITTNQLKWKELQIYKGLQGSQLNNNNNNNDNNNNNNPIMNLQARKSKPIDDNEDLVKDSMHDVNSLLIVASVVGGILQTYSNLFNHLFSFYGSSHVSCNTRKLVFGVSYKV